MRGARTVGGEDEDGVVPEPGVLVRLNHLPHPAVQHHHHSRVDSPRVVHNLRKRGVDVDNLRWGDVVRIVNALEREVLEERGSGPGVRRGDP